jgi:hypothetical protein
MREGSRDNEPMLPANCQMEVSSFRMGVIANTISRRFDTVEQSTITERACSILAD